MKILYFLLIGRYLLPLIAGVVLAPIVLHFAEPNLHPKLYPAIFFLLAIVIGSGVWGLITGKIFE